MTTLQRLGSISQLRLEQWRKVRVVESDGDLRAEMRVNPTYVFLPHHNKHNLRSNAYRHRRRVSRALLAKLPVLVNLSSSQGIVILVRKDVLGKVQRSLSKTWSTLKCVEHTSDLGEAPQVTKEEFVNALIFSFSLELGDLGWQTLGGSLTRCNPTCAPKNTMEVRID